MINNILARLTTDSSIYLDEAKVKVLSAAKTMGSSKLPQPPSPQGFINKLKSTEVKSIEDLQKLDNIYNKTIQGIDIPLGTLNGTKDELTDIKNKLTKIQSNFEKLNEVISVIEPIVNTLRNLLPLLDNLLVSQNPATGINGASLKKSFDFIDKGKDKVQKGLDSISNVPKFAARFENEISPIMSPLDKGIESLDTSINKLNNLKTLIMSLYEQFISLLSFPEINEIIDETGESWEDYVEDNFEEISNQGISLTTVIKEYYSNGIRIGYEITKE